MSRHRSSSSPIERLNDLLAQIRNTNPDEINPEQFELVCRLSSEMQLSGAELGAVNRTILLPQIWRARSVTTQNYSHLLELCNLFESTSGASHADPDARYIVSIMIARALIASCLSTDCRIDQKSAALKTAYERLLQASRIQKRYGIAHLANLLTEHEHLLSGIQKNEICTVLRFDLPFAISVPDGTYVVRLNESQFAELEVIFRPPAAARFGATWEDSGISFENISIDNPDAMPSRISDDEARIEYLISSRTLLGFSALRIKLPYMLDTYGTPPLPAALEQLGQAPLDPMVLHQYPQEFQDVVRVTNLFIDHIRVASGRYELDRITVADIEAVAMVTYVSDIKFMQLPYRGSGPYRIRRGAVEEPSWLSVLRSNMVEPIPLDTVSRLILDAKKYLLQKELRLAVFNVNAAFELFINTHIAERLSTILPDNELRAFLDGESIFDNCREALIEKHAAGAGREYLVAAELLPTPVLQPGERQRPSVGQLVKRMQKHASFGISGSKLNKLVNQIRYRRNEVAHGTVHDADLEPERIAQSLKALDEFIQMARKTSPQS